MASATTRPPSRVRFRRHLACMLAMLAFAAVCRLQAAEAPKAPKAPAANGSANWKLAYKYSPEFLKKFTYSTTVTPKWIGKSDTFWYEYRTSRGNQFYRVNPQQATREPLFDNAKLATHLSEATRKPLEPSILPIANVSVNDEGNKMKFVTEGFQYEYDLRNDKLEKLGKAPAAPAGDGFQKGGGKGKKGGSYDDDLDDANQQDDSLNWQFDLDVHESFQDLQDEAQQKQKKGGKGGQPQADGGKKGLSPDGKIYVYAKDHNLWLKEEGKDEIQLTKDGTESYSFGGGAKGKGKDNVDQIKEDQIKDKDKDDQIKDKEDQFKGDQFKGGGGKGGGGVNWAKDSKSFYTTRIDSRGVKDLYLINSVAQPRPTLTSYGYPMPGEEHIRHPELHVWSNSTGKLVRVGPKWKDESYSDFHWGKNPEELRFTRHDRLLRNVEFCSLNTTTLDCRCLIADGFENANIVVHPIKYLDDSTEMIWWSERSGWGHFYLYDREGKLKNPITSGAFRASSDVAVDQKNRILYFKGNSREEGENAYYEHLYSIRFDGTGLTLLDPGNANHQSTLSPSKQFLVDNASRVDMVPVSVLRDHRGAKIMDLEQADLSSLIAVGWKMPETFTVKAADGVTDLFGNMWKPFDFDPNKKYPIIAHVYPGPQTESMSPSFSATNGQQQLAQLGFIVIQVGNRGGSPLRSKLYGSYGYWNLRDYALSDKKTAIEELAARYPFIDIDRVGIYGHSGGGFLSSAALLQKPYNEFFKVAVSSSGNHDNNIYNNQWAERYHGLKEVPIDELAKGEAKAEKGGKGGFKGKGKKGGGDDEAFDQDKGDEKKDQDKDAKKVDKMKDMKDQGKDDAKTKETKFVIKVPTNAELAGNLKGKLLLVHGDMDNNVHPANTIRLVDALIKANKRFDMLIMPGKAHGYADFQPYFNQRMWEYFAEHLLDDRSRGADLYDRRDSH
jgi:dipeptidyl-peptidase 4